MSDQFAVVEETKDKAARVNVSHNGQALKESFYLTQYCGKKQIDSGLVWFILLSKTIFVITGVKI